MQAAVVKEMARQFEEEFMSLEHPRLELADQLLADNFVRHIYSGSQDKEALLASLKRMPQFFPDGTIRVLDMVAEQDRVAVRWIFRGTFTENGRPLETPGMSLYRIEGSRIAEAWSFHDRLAELEQLGLTEDNGNEK